MQKLPHLASPTFFQTVTHTHTHTYIYIYIYIYIEKRMVMELKRYH